MKKALIQYFTSTGNTGHAVSIVRDYLIKSGFSVKSVRIEHDVSPPGGSYDNYLFAFPFLSFGAPEIVKKYLRRLPFGDGKKAGILAISGAVVKNGKIHKGWGGRAIEQAEKLLRKRGYDVFLSKYISYPDNWTQVADPPGPDDVKQIFSEADKGAGEYAKEFINGERNLYRCGIINNFWSGIINILFGLIGRRFFGKLYIADTTCNGCGICVKTCPAGAIKLFNKKPRWKSNCLLCNRCINICPRRSIQFSPIRALFHLTILVILFILGIAGVSYYTPVLFPVLPLYLVQFIKTALIVFLFIFLHWAELVIIDWPVLFFEQIPIIRQVFSISWTNKFRRYKASDFNIQEKQG